MTPFEIKILMHYHCCSDEAKEFAVPIWEGTMRQFVADDLLRQCERTPYGATYVMTERGHVYCEALQRVPLPVQEWRIPAVIEP